MTNPSAQTVLERLLHAVKTSDSYANRAGGLASIVAEFEASRAASAPAAVREALDLAVNMIMANEPGDSRAVSDEAVALAAVACGDTSEAVMTVIRAVLATPEEASTAAAPRTRTEICMNEKCPRGQGVPVEIVTAPPAAQTDGVSAAAQSIPQVTATPSTGE